MLSYANKVDLARKITRGSLMVALVAYAVNINAVVKAHNPTDVVIEESASINAQSTIALLKKLEMKNPKLARIFVVADNARYYRNRLVREFLKTSKIQILFLPPYSPNLNLIER